MLTTNRLQRATELTDSIRNSQQVVWDALVEIHEDQLYVDMGYKTMAQWAHGEFNWGRTYLHRNIAAAKNRQLLSENVANWQHATHESQLRPLTILEDEEKIEAWELAVEKAEGAPTAKIVEEAVREIRGVFEVETPPLPENKYRCIVVDPPWPMKKIERVVRPKQGAVLDYATMALEDISALPVSDLAHEEGCHLYLWVTHKYLPAGLEIAKEWGFNYQCLMTWVKPTGMTPYSWMYNTEHVIFASMGNLKLERLGLKLSFEAPVIRGTHSTKPHLFYARAAEASTGPRLNMFAREERNGFEAWGNEVKSS